MDITDLILLLVAFLGATVAAFWLSMVIWAFRDIRSRIQDLPTQFLATLLVAVLNIPGLLIYLILRPRETLAEAYERALEEELILQSLEELEQCPGCGRRRASDGFVCRESQAGHNAADERTVAASFSGDYPDGYRRAPQARRHVTPLSPLQQRVLHLLGFFPDLYTRLAATHTAKPP